MPTKGKRRVNKRKPAKKMSIVRVVNRVLAKQQELKNFDKTLAQVAPLTGFVTALSNVNQADDYGNRTGRQIYAKSLQFELYCSTTIASTAPDFIRIIVIKDKDQHGVNTPTIPDYLLSTSVYSMRDPDPQAMKRFECLADIKVPLSAQRNVAVVKRYIPLNFKIYFAGTSTSNASQGQNSLWMIVLGSQSLQTSNIDGNMRLRYTDD